MSGTGLPTRWADHAVAAALAVLLLAVASLATASASRAGGRSCGTDRIDARALAAAGAVPVGETSPGPSATCRDAAAPAAPGPLRVRRSTSTSISVSWLAPRAGVRVAGYDVFVAGAKVATLRTTSYNVRGLACGTAYEVAVAAYDAAGRRSSRASVRQRTSACNAIPSVYWGAYIEGVRTYGYLYGGAWSDGPWCDPGTQCPLPRFEQDAGKQPSIEHWGMCWTCSFDREIADRVVARGNIPAVDWSNAGVSDADVAAGKYDGWLTTQAEAMARFAHPLFLLFDEEMNGRWYSYSPGQNGNTAADFVAMWRHVHDVFLQNGATNVTWVWCPNVDSNHSYVSLSSVYPGDDYVDWTGLNGYNWGGGAGAWKTFGQVFGRTYEDLRALAPGKPIMIGEVASEERDGSKASWILDALSTELPTRFQQIKAVLWFNWRIFEKGQFWNWEIESSPASQQAFAAAITLPYFVAGGRFGNLPLLTKIRPLQDARPVPRRRTAR